MTFKINGFGGKPEKLKEVSPACDLSKTAAAPRRSVVQIHFPGRGMALAYYNNLFDLKVGDRVYVDGKMEGQLGCVVEICYNFKIKISEYKKVIAVCDTNVNGQFFMAGSHFVTFDPASLPAEKVSLWFRAPLKEDEEFVSGYDDTSIHLDNLNEMNVTHAIAERGHNYFLENRVRYLCLDGNRGYAIVEGTKVYTVEFEYRNGEIRNLVCDCFCSYTCKHEFAAMLQLKETLALIEKHYPREYARTGYFAAINKGSLFSFAISERESGSFTL